MEQIEREKYQKIWGYDAYRRVSPGFDERKPIVEWLKRHACENVLDLGCGSGRLDKHLLQNGFSVRMVDIAENCLNSGVRDALCDDLTFETACLWSDEVAAMRADAVICIDVLEHIPPEYVDQVVHTLRNAAPHGYVNAATFHDSCGRLIGQKLHLTVRPAGWWHAKFPDAHCSVRGNDAWMIW